VILGLLVAAAARSPAAVADNSEMASSGTPKVAFTIGHLPKAGPYVAALRLVGLDVEVFTPHNPPAALDGFAGLVLGGGGDVDPAYYGEVPAGTRNPNPKRDEMELELFRLARERDLAVLGICRGLQLMNVACGGTLHQDIGAAHSEVRHAVSVPPGSKLHGVVGNENFEIVSRHHQAIKNAAPGLSVTASAPDGIVEAIEDAARRFVIGVQWHPEDNIDSREDQALFRSFARAAGVAGD
jgi:putative glutamine amidotransferase